MNTNIELAELKHMSAGQLKGKYLQIFGEPSRSGNKDFLRKRLAWRIQSLTEGTLSERARQRASELARDADIRMTMPRSPSTTPGADRSVRPAPAKRDERVPMPGAVLGYSLVADTSQQKMLLVVGPKRSGKGTIGRVLTRLVGAGNVVGPTTSSLASPFGLQPLIGKSLAIVSDARFSGDSVGVVIERLLCISGEDTLTVDRKFMGSITMKLPTRFMFLTNELPRMNDASGALAGRFVILRLIRSLYGHEDTTLTQQLMKELPGILVWAIDGLKRLRARGHFKQPQAVADAVQEMEDLASPVMAFVRDCCDVGVGKRTWTDDMYNQWKRWCESDGRNMITSKQVFGRDLSAAVPGVVCRRHNIQGRFYDGIALRAGGVL